MAHIIDTLMRSTGAFIVMMFVTRILGKSTISRMTYHDFVATITLGAMTANLSINTSMNVWQVLVAIVTFSGIAYLLMALALKSRAIRKWVSGQPTVIMEDGKILESNMRKLKMTMDTLNQELREKNIFNIEEVQYAVLELNGKITVLRKPEYLPVTRKDMNLQMNKQSFPVELIMDGQIISDTCIKNHISEEWLISQAKSRSLTIGDICYAVKSSNGQLYFDRYDDRIHQPVDKE
ncbi:Uncharacterized membrane protein YcaP, DUF421 family [Paenibacillus tianmuensis]|uniref:Uncharacterized membrane protein YcaP, DUF421 family n=1 Tax=Paenibacillus tianmuensis TaxID=624147 RepID=A0A1G4P9D0_9BACL|nr:DUF421 domain-containing protein [Paenibacillus tianmuensis]SCW28834.1 Uncharacterized membrane protein YcaP, DUF421 family [Paenibacillus tianmuensis]